MNLTKSAIRTQYRMDCFQVQYRPMSPLPVKDQTYMHEMWARWSPAQRRAWSHGVALRVMFA